MYQYSALIDRVVDGDTAIMTVDLGFRIYTKVYFRFYGIDTPERGQPGWAEATEYVNNFFIRFPHVKINCYKQDKYGRWLVEIVDPRGGTLNKCLVDDGLAKVYGT